MLSRIRSLGLAALVSALVATPALAGPPWISIELPANPYDKAPRVAWSYGLAGSSIEIHGGPARAGVATRAETTAARPSERMRENMRGSWKWVTTRMPTEDPGLELTWFAAEAATRQCP